MACDRCGKTCRISFVFYEIDSQNINHKFGSFCRECTIELIDNLKDKLEWFQIQEGWRGYVLTKARSKLEELGFIHTKYDTKCIEIKKHGDDNSLRRENKLDVLRIAYATGLISQQEYRERLIR